MTTGSKHSDKTRERMRKSHTGKTLPLEVRNKISIAHKNLAIEKREKIDDGIRNRRYNEEYAKKLSDTKLGEKNPQSVLTADKVLQIRKLWKTGNYTAPTLGAEFGVSRQTINDVIKERTWKHVVPKENINKIY